MNFSRVSPHSVHGEGCLEAICVQQYDSVNTTAQQHGYNSTGMTERQHGHEMGIIISEAPRAVLSRYIQNVRLSHMFHGAENGELNNTDLIDICYAGRFCGWGRETFSMGGQLLAPFDPVKT